jgi:hypothetical protein
LLRTPIADLSLSGSLQIFRKICILHARKEEDGGSDRGGVGGAGDAGGRGDGQQVPAGREARSNGAVAAAEAAVRDVQWHGEGGVPLLAVVRRGRRRVPHLRGHAEDAVPELRRVRDRAPGDRSDRRRLRRADPATVQQAVISSALLAIRGRRARFWCCG